MKVANIDFLDPGASKLFVDSLKYTGFAILNNHQISHDLIFDTYTEWQRFFKSDEKFKYTFEPTKQAGYFPFKSENAKGYSVKDLKEFYHFYKWYGLPAGLSDKTSRLFDELEKLGELLLEWVENHTPTQIKTSFSMPLKEMVKNCDNTLKRIIHYPALSNDYEELGAVRAQAHEDINILTLLPAATAPGLQVLDLQGNWHDITCEPAAIVVNAGDMLQEATKGHFKSTTHRVINPIGEEANKSRYSMPLFLHAHDHIRLSERYTVKEYLHQRLKEIGLMAK